jgi:hypothetical protein
MRRSRALAGLLLLALTMMAGPVHAGDGALAAIYQLAATIEGVEEPETLYLTVMVKGSQVVLLVLTPGGAAPWSSGVAELNGPQVTGMMLDSGGEELGPFDLHFTADSVQGTLTTFFFDLVTVTGPRVF